MIQKQQSIGVDIQYFTDLGITMKLKPINKAIICYVRPSASSKILSITMSQVTHKFIRLRCWGFDKHAFSCLQSCFGLWEKGTNGPLIRLHTTYTWRPNYLCPNLRRSDELSTWICCRMRGLNLWTPGCEPRRVFELRCERDIRCNSAGTGDRRNGEFRDSAAWLTGVGA